MRGASLDAAPLKIVHVCGWYFPDSLGGTEAYVEAVTDRLRAAGHEVLIAAPEPGATAPRGYDHRHIPIFRYPIAAAPTRAEAQHVVPVPGAQYLHAWLSEIRADVVHFHTFVTDFDRPIRALPASRSTSNGALDPDAGFRRSERISRRSAT